MQKVEAERSRLSKYKNSKAQRLKELEDQNNKNEIFQNVDTDKLIQILSKKDQENR